MKALTAALAGRAKWHPNKTIPHVTTEIPGMALPCGEPLVDSKSEGKRRMRWSEEARRLVQGAEHLRPRRARPTDAREHTSKANDSDTESGGECSDDDESVM